MWMGLIGGIQALAAANAENQAENVIPEGAPGAAGEQNGNIPGFSGKMPTAQELLEALDSMTGISEEEKESIREQLLQNPGGSASQTIAGNDVTTQTIMLLSLLAVIALIFVFFVYKLFKCLSEREMKREEKKKNKQLKKKK